LIRSYSGRRSVISFGRELSAISAPKICPLSTRWCRCLLPQRLPVRVSLKSKLPDFVRSEQSERNRFNDVAGTPETSCHVCNRSPVSDRGNLNKPISYATVWQRLYNNRN